jgi:aerobic C4-dicarboxylate transport protein
MAPLGDAFIKAIRMLIAPIIFCTVVHGIARIAVASASAVAAELSTAFECLPSSATADASLVKPHLDPCK